jgi:hypothetical protein
MKDFKTILLESIQAQDPQAFGDLKVHREQNTFFVTGTLYTLTSDVNALLQNVINDYYPNALTYVAVKTRSAGLSVNLEENGTPSSSWTIESDSPLDEVGTLYLGMLPRTHIKKHEGYKRVNFETFSKTKNVITVLGVYNPIILDKNLKVIDGMLRLDIAEKLEQDEVPVMILNCEGTKADFLRLVLNRSSEFQRWIYEEVDNFVDAHPQTQALLEPLGFFSNKVLPTSFFGNTVMDYTLDEFNDQMKKYQQDIGLAEWAKMRKEEILTEEALKQARRNANPSKEGKTSLFDLSPTEDDFMEVIDVRKVVTDHVESMKVVAGTITDNFDVERKAAKEAAGHAWQSSRRTSKGLSADKRAAAEAAALKLLDAPMDEDNNDGE